MWVSPIDDERGHDVDVGPSIGTEYSMGALAGIECIGTLERVRVDDQG